MHVKSCPVEIKAAGDHEGTEEGVFEALVAAYNVDSCGDQIVPGAFADSLKTWSGSGAPIPVYWSHRMDDPDYNIGHVIEARETDDGLWVKAQIDLEGPKAKQVYRLLKGRRVRMFSFSYDIEDSFKSKSDTGDDINELRRLKLYEVGPTAIGMNQSTDLLAVKAMEATPVYTYSYDDAEQKKAVGSHSSDTADGAWDGPANEKKLPDELTEATARAMYAWKDPDGDPTARSTWRFPHHFVGQDGKPGAASIQACNAGIAVLNGGRGGTKIPDDDMKAVYTHLAKHIRDSGATPAPFGGGEKPSSDSGNGSGPGSDSSKAAGDPPTPPQPDGDGEKPKQDPVELAAALNRETTAVSKTAKALYDALKGTQSDGAGSGDKPKPTPPAPPQSSDSGKAMPDVEPAASSSGCTCGARAKGDEPARSGAADLRLNTELALLEAEFG